MEREPEKVVFRLENLVRRAQLQQPEAADLVFRIYPPHTPVEPYIIEVSRGRFVRRVPVDGITVRRILMGRPDAGLMRDLRTAMLTVIRHSRGRE